jgi:hypothetical protein
MNTFSSFGAGFLRRSLPGILPVLFPWVAAVLISALPVSMARGAPLLQNALSLGTASGASGTDVIVPLNLANQDAVGGIQLDIAFDPAVVSFTSAAIVPRVASMSIGASTPATGTLRVLMYFGGGGNIAAGTGAVANLTFHLVGTGSSALTPNAWELSDPTGHAIIGVTATAGEITVTGGSDPTGACCAPSGTCAVTTQAGCVALSTWQGAATTCAPSPCPPPPAGETLSIGVASGASGSDVAVPLSLHNTVAVGGLQFDILFDPAVVSFTSAAITSRATGMSIPTSNPAAGRLRLLMYSGEGSSIAAGDGAVANLIFRIIGAQGSGCDLTPDAATLADPSGHALQLTAYAGHITVTGGGDPTGACCATAGTCVVTIQAACTAPSTWQGASAPCTPNPCPPPQSTETLSIGTASGASGGDVAVPLGFHNTVAIGGIQLDVLFDPAVVSFVSAAITSRATGMSIPTSTPSAGRLRVVMYFGGGGSIPAGDGAVANLTFRIVGLQGSGCDLTPDAATLSDPDAHAVPVTATAGHITVIGGGDPTGACCAPAGTCGLTTQPNCTGGTWRGANTTCTPNPCPPAQPDLRLAVLKNPGRTRTLQIFVTSDVELDAPPTVVLSGGVAVLLTQFPGVNIFQGNTSVDDGTASVTVQATGIHDGATGTAQSTVTF